MPSDSERLDIIAAAERMRCSEKAIRRRINKGTLPAVKERVIGRHGRPVYKVFVNVAELEASFAPIPIGPAAKERLVREVTAAAPRFSEEQREILLRVFRSDQ
ncbi:MULTISPECIES: hypothetical protein [unclassified Microbacterium]|uniref:hypothetical protein n=1 Tax=unclassified Microbacterium TaxID=2609290 RepID=UPI00301803A3